MLNRVAAMRALATLERELIDVTNTAQMRFDIHRLTFPLDFNFESWLNNDPQYRDLTMKISTLKALVTDERMGKRT